MTGSSPEAREPARGDTPPAVRVAVVGIGHLGRHHARILATLPGARLVAVADILRERADDAAAKTGARAVSDVRDVLDEVDAVTVAVPTTAHLAVALPCLERGVSVLVEKPMAATLSEAEMLVRAASASGAVLAVGHTERYNPAVQAIAALVTTPRFVEVHRLGTFPDRSLDIDVIFDLMIHDLDVILSLVQSDVAAVDAVGVPVLTDRIDIANARLRFESGCIANVTASRISRDRVRKLRFFQPDMYVSVDYAEQDVETWRLVRGGAGRPSIEGGKLPVERREPLVAEMADFVRAVRERTRPLVSGGEGLRALALATRIHEAITKAQTPGPEP
jgi:predicted dehydrogenase